MINRAIGFAAILSCTVANAAFAQASSEADELAKQLANPIANLISVPFQNNFDFDAGENDDGFAYTLNIQPVIPVPINQDWLVISRTILPIAYRDYLPAPSGDTFGFGDITQSLFFSPTKAGPGGITWGVGPAFLIPTATDDLLGTGKVGLGPTGVVLKQEGKWTVGALGNQIWSIFGEAGREDVNQTFMQPFLAYSLGHGTTLNFTTETTYDWEHETWTVPLNFLVTKVFKAGKQPMSLQGGARYFAEGPEGTPEWGMRVALVFLYPEKH